MASTSGNQKTQELRHASRSRSLSSPAVSLKPQTSEHKREARSKRGCSSKIASSRMSHMNHSSYYSQKTKRNGAQKRQEKQDQDLAEGSKSENAQNMVGKEKEGPGRSTHEEGKTKAQTPTDPLRVQPDSRVNLYKLSDAELTQRYVNRWKELKSLQARYEKMAKKEKEERKGKPGKHRIPSSLTGLKTARERLRNVDFQIPDCQRLLYNLAQVIAEGLLSPKSEEFSLICAIVQKVKAGQLGTVNPQLYALLQGASKENLIDFVTKINTTLNDGGGGITRPSLLLQRPRPFQGPQYLALPGPARPPLIVYAMKPLSVQNAVRQQTGVQDQSECISPPLKAQRGEKKKEQSERVKVSRLSFEALKKFNEERGEPLPYGGLGSDR